MTNGKGKVEKFAAANPVFTREQFRHALFQDQPISSADSLLRYHASTGRFRHVAPNVYAVVPAHLDPATFQADRLLVASRIRPDGIIAYHSALDFHGLSYSDSNEVQVLSHGRPGILQTEVGPIRFVLPAADMRREGTERMGVNVVDRRGQDLSVTGIERSLVDCLERPAYAGGLEELAHALSTVEYIDVDLFVDVVLARGNRVLAALAGCWLQSRASDHFVEPAQLDRLRGFLPAAMTPTLGVRPHEGTASHAWKIWLPEEILRPAFEGNEMRPGP